MTRRLIGLFVLALAITGSARIAAQSQDASVLAFFKTYDTAFSARDLTKLAALHHADVTRYEGSFVNTGWADYRDNHLAAEFKDRKSQEFVHSNIVVHMLGDNAAYVTADYLLKYPSADRTVESGGIATMILVKEGGAWKLRHHHTASRRRPAGGF
jgi:ketosteroid isomerase-like protein